GPSRVGAVADKSEHVLGKLRKGLTMRNGSRDRITCFTCRGRHWAMTRPCVTHHQACDCREARFREIEAENERLASRLGALQKAIEADLSDAKAVCGGD